MKMKKDRPYILLGAGGHAKVLIDMLLANQCTVLGYINPQKVDDPFFDNFQYIGDDQSFINNTKPQCFYLVNGVGSIKETQNRTRLYLQYVKQHFEFPTIIHPSAIISPFSQIAYGVQIMPGVIINTGSIIKENTIINSGAIIEHDCFIGKHCHIAPGVTLSGNVCVNNKVHIGTSATIIQSICIENKATIAAGAVVIKKVIKKTLVAGNPAKKIK